MEIFNTTRRSELNCMFCVFGCENRAFCGLMWKIMIGADWPQMVIKYDACALHAV